MWRFCCEIFGCLREKINSENRSSGPPQIYIAAIVDPRAEIARDSDDRESHTQHFALSDHDRTLESGINEKYWMEWRHVAFLLHLHPRAKPRRRTRYKDEPLAQAFSLLPSLPTVWVTEEGATASWLPNWTIPCHRSTSIQERMRLRAADRSTCPSKTLQASTSRRSVADEGVQAEISRVV